LNHDIVNTVVIEFEAEEPGLKKVLLRDMLLSFLELSFYCYYYLGNAFGLWS